MVSPISNIVFKNKNKEKVEKKLGVVWAHGEEMN